MDKVDNLIAPKLLPTGRTPESLAEWILDKNVHNFGITKTYEFTEAEIQAKEHLLSVTVIEISKLKDLEKTFKLHLKQGVEIKTIIEIPQSDGLAKLTLRKESLETIIDTGEFSEEMTIYGIADPNSEVIFYYDIEGNEQDQHHRDMDSEEKADYASPLFKDSNSAAARSHKVEPGENFKVGICEADIEEHLQNHKTDDSSDKLEDDIDSALDDAPKEGGTF